MRDVRSFFARYQMAIVIAAVIVASVGQTLIVDGNVNHTVTNISDKQAANNTACPHPVVAGQPLQIASTRCLAQQTAANVTAIVGLVQGVIADDTANIDTNRANQARIADLDKQIAALQAASTTTTTTTVRVVPTPVLVPTPVPTIVRVPVTPKPSPTPRLSPQPSPSTAPRPSPSPCLLAMLGVSC